jgi:hypothetical protein
VDSGTDSFEDLLVRELHSDLDQGFAAIHTTWNDSASQDKMLVTVARLLESVRQRQIAVTSTSNCELLRNRSNELERLITYITAHAESSHERHAH